MFLQIKNIKKKKNKVLARIINYIKVSTLIGIPFGERRMNKENIKTIDKAKLRQTINSNEMTNEKKKS